ncbi:MAG: ribosome biogenesis GTP-binding protein YihA/YsxC [Clostridia bacterium]|nr:ribosome biogenesis GTP-binding protein YihA/YsxC [Clostridia bacterium]
MNTYSNAKFITSAASKSQFITTDKPIIAVCGKSNVGKSSFINMLAGQNKLAKVSQEPGRTRLVNYFDFGAFILADLPGYGYAKVSKSEKEKWAKLLDDFFAEGCTPAHVFALCDIRHEPTENDKVMVNYLYQRVIPFTVVATKADKLSKAQTNKSLTMLATAYTCGKDAIVATSAKTRFGLERVIEEINKVVERHGENNIEG